MTEVTRITLVQEETQEETKPGINKCVLLCLFTTFSLLIVIFIVAIVVIMLEHIIVATAVMLPISYCDQWEYSV
jgi:hypothetical protein